jgi:hypothetical protein
MVLGNSSPSSSTTNIGNQHLGKNDEEDDSPEHHQHELGTSTVPTLVFILHATPIHLPPALSFKYKSAGASTGNFRFAHNGTSRRLQESLKEDAELLHAAMRLWSTS